MTYTRGSGIIPLMRRLWQISDWKPYYDNVLLMTQNGCEVEDIAKAVGKTKRQIIYIRGSQAFKDKLEKETLARAIKEDNNLSAHQRIRKLINDNCERAIKNIIEIANNPKTPPKLRYEASKDLADRGGTKAIEVIETHDRVLLPEESASMQKTLAEVEHSILRLSNNSSEFLLSRKTSTLSSATDKGSDEPKQDVPKPDTVDVTVEGHEPDIETRP